MCVRVSVDSYTCVLPPKAVCQSQGPRMTVTKPCHAAWLLVLRFELINVFLTLKDLFLFVSVYEFIFRSFVNADALKSIFRCKRGPNAL